MNQPIHSTHVSKFIAFSKKNDRAFTLTELAVVIATIAVLTALVLPALAGVANKGGRAQCANNLRQIYVASMVYATEYHDWLPINQVHTGSIYINRLNGMNYTYYVLSPSGYAGIPNSFVPTNAPATYFSDLGFLYHADLAGNGSMFYCPDQWGSLLGASVYSPLLTSDSTGRVRSSYAFNPRLVDASNGVVTRRFQRISDLPPHKLFTVDYFGSAGGMPHIREGGGWNVLFTDGSVQYSMNAGVNYLIRSGQFVDSESIQSYEMADYIFNLLELDH
jgi:type II secretory pathway pseudopilin PulG